MRPRLWRPPIELSALEQSIVKRIKKAKLFTFLRMERQELFNESFQEELARMYAEQPKGHPPVPPAQLALATILQAYTGASDAEAIEAMTMDRRWQLVLDCLDCEEPPFCQATLVRFRTALIIHGLDRKLIERTVEVLRDLNTGLVRAVGVTPANVPEASVTAASASDLQVQKAKLAELHIDRAYLSSCLVKERSDDLIIYCKAWPVRNGKHFPKTAFVLDWQQGTICCPNQVSVPFSVGGVVHFPPEACASCPLRERCTSSTRGRSVSIHADERLLQELRERQLTPQGRAKLRERVAVEHSLSHIGRWQGARARYVGLRKNLFDLRRTAVVHNLHVIAKIVAQSQDQQPSHLTPLAASGQLATI